MATKLDPQDRRRILAAFPESLRTKAVDADSILATVQSLEAMNVNAGLASRWSRETAWKQNPWQLIQVSSSRAMLALLPALPATTRIPLFRMARIVAVAGRPSHAWPSIVEEATKYPGKSGEVAQRLACRCLFAAWTTLQRRHHLPDNVMTGWVDTVLRAALPVVEAQRSKRMAADAIALVNLPPEEAVACAQRQQLDLLALPEVIASVAVYEHLRKPAEAEAWLNRMLIERP
ncbi:MAG: hypothetical protein WC876_07790 [Candidatus Thermoplasmatota archaeon]